MELKNSEVNAVLDAIEDKIAKLKREGEIKNYDRIRLLHNAWVKIDSD